MSNKILSIIGVAVLAIVLVVFFFTNKPETICKTAKDMSLQNNVSPLVSNFDFPQNHQLPDEFKSKIVRINTNCGSFSISFFDSDAPFAVENFLRLAESGRLAGAPFHRVISGFMIQGGDYTKGDGTGGQSAWGRPFPDELNPETESYKAGYKRGVVAMANAGPNTSGSQFFIMHADYPLSHNYTIFGQVIDGMDIIDKIAGVPVLENSFGEKSVPTEKIIIESVSVENRL